METKTCCSCRESLSLASFRKNRSRKDGLSPNCRECAKTYERERYADLSDKKKRKVNDTKVARRKKMQKKVYKYLSTHPCVDCGNPNPVVLEFDHVRGSKEFNISDLIRGGYGWRRIKREIDKCDVRCANCHRIRTAEAGGWSVTLFGK